MEEKQREKTPKQKTKCNIKSSLFDLKKQIKI